MKINKKLTTTFSFLILSSVVFAPVFAETSNVTVTKTRVLTTTSALKEQNQETRISNLKTRANTEIDKRVSSLNELVTKINANKKLSSTQKSSFVSDIQNEIDALKTLKTKINADTDPDMLKTDVKSIVDSYRVYALYMPKIRILEGADIINVNVTNFNNLATKLNERITKAKTEGKKVTDLETIYTELTTKVTDATLQSTNAYNLVINLTPSGYPGNKTQLEQARTDIKNASTDLKTARADAKKIIDGLKLLNPKVTSTLTTTNTLTP